MQTLGTELDRTIAGWGPEAAAALKRSRNKDRFRAAVERTWRLRPDVGRFVLMHTNGIYIAKDERPRKGPDRHKDWWVFGMYLDDGIYYTSLLKFRDVYRTNRDLVCQKLDELAPLGVSYTKPRGGVYVWCRLPDGVDSKRFIRRAYNMGVTLIPGHVFYPCKNGGRDHIRINYSYESDERLLAGMEVFRAALLESLEG